MGRRSAPRRGQRAPRAGRPRLRLPRLRHRPGRGRHARRASLWSEADPEQVKADDGRRCASGGKEAQPSGIKTFGSTFVNPDDSRGPRAAPPASCSTRRAPGGWSAAAPGCLRQARELRRERGRGATAADVLAVMAAARRARPRALRRRARARGPDARRGRVARGLGARGMRASRSRLDGSPPASPRRRRPGRPAVGGYCFWLRDSSLVAVDEVEVEGRDGQRGADRRGAGAGAPTA